ncbi:stalk domain-containing protein [Alkaliphilus peptidifermentans]|uniref:Copper amine oxidase N-terminal domain-containing protein n=1 Tax=Alkaliphilus peptidifermentans DSM 18978 TaxID=1120976 RepID=A0A1G5DVX5_9FIRM|nr:stalk domain-containing protein [Alkaliphilus peptidifermentans]SCY18398.1 Copper amine oxidase N-terminal domain-containing protein [Alkaliphilus peptidifermentans DSM 18978]
MKKKMILALTIMLFVTTAFVSAASVNGEFKGFPVVNVKVNGTTVDSSVPAVNFFGSTLLPVRSIAETFNAIVDWDGDTWTVNLIKPDVDMMFFEDIWLDEYEDLNFTHAFKYSSTGYNSLFTHTQVDGLPIGTYDLRVVILDPNNQIIFTTQEYTYTIEDEDLNAFYLTNYYEDIYFKEIGKYKFQFQIKINDKYESVSEKVLIIVD